MRAPTQTLASDCEGIGQWQGPAGSRAPRPRAPPPRLPALANRGSPRAGPVHRPGAILRRAPTKQPRICPSQRGSPEGTTREGRPAREEGTLNTCRGDGGGGRRSLVPPSSSGSSTPLITRIGRARGTHNDKMNALSASRSASRGAGAEGGAGEGGNPWYPLSQPTGEGAMITNGRAHGNAN